MQNPFLNYKLKVNPKNGEPRDRHTELVDKTRKLVDRPYPQMAKLIKDSNIPDRWLEQWLAYCSDAVNPAATWWKLWNDSKVDKTP